MTPFVSIVSYRVLLLVLTPLLTSASETQKFNCTWRTAASATTTPDKDAKKIT